MGPSFGDNPFSGFVGSFSLNQAEFRQVLEIALHGSGRFSDCFPILLLIMILSCKNQHIQISFSICQVFYRIIYRIIYQVIMVSLHSKLFHKKENSSQKSATLSKASGHPLLKKESPVTSHQLWDFPLALYQDTNYGSTELVSFVRNGSGRQKIVVNSRAAYRQ